MLNNSIMMMLCQCIQTKMFFLWIQYHKLFEKRVSFNTLKWYDKKISEVPLFRSSKIQDKYHRLSIEDQNIFLNNLFIDDENKNYSLTLNNYPYFLEPDIEHLILWINPKISLDILDSEYIIKNKLEVNKISYNKIIYTKNKMKYKSVKSIDHIHIFIQT